MNSINSAKFQRKKRSASKRAPMSPYDMFSLARTVRVPVPKFPFQEATQKILGSSYSLTLVLIGDRRARTLNKKTRGKTYTPNVLSFPLTKKCGEVYLNLPCAVREAKREGVSLHDRTGFLFIHGLLHLKGLKHGSTMESTEQAWCAQFHIVHPAHVFAQKSHATFQRHRSRN